jgi:endoglucanase
MAIGGISLFTSYLSSAELTFLRTDGQNIVNERGEKVLLQGIGLGNWLLPEGYMWKFGELGDRPRRIEKIVSDLIGPESATRFWLEFRRNYITEADVQQIAEFGFNSVRPALNARLFLTESDPPQTVPEGFTLLDNLVKWCRTHGIYVIIDMHGAPGGQTGQNIDDSANDEPELFMQPKNQDSLVNLWVAIAKRYKDEPIVAGYDLLNEPLPARTGAAAKYKHLLEPLYKRLTKAIREVDSKHMIILEGADWANDWSVFGTPFDKNIVYQFHYYCWDTPAQLKGIRPYLDYRKRLNAPVWVGETGERDNTIYWATTDYFEANNIGWCFWPWKKLDADNSPCSIKRPQHWDAVSAYSRGAGKPSSEIAQHAFDELLVNIRLENCTRHAAVVNAMFRRAPGRVEAENFGHGGTEISYSVKGEQRSKFYRLDEPVQIGVQDPTRRLSGQYITLSANEWTAYSIDSEAADDCLVRLRVRAVDGSGAGELLIGNSRLNVKVTDNNWLEVELGAVPFDSGTNRLKWTVTRGKIDLDWIDFKAAEKTQSSSITKPIAQPN